MISYKKILGGSLVALGLGLFVGQSADAASVLTESTDLKGYAATITTQNDGTNVLTTKKGEYVLNEDAKIYSSASIIITLNNTKPVNVNSINAKHTLELRGNGEMNVDTTDDVAINVGTHFRAFKTTKYGKGKVTASAAKIGLNVKNEIQMEGGYVEASGSEYGVYSDNDIKPYYDAVLKGVSSNGTGIYAYRDIYAWKGATVIGEGKVAGARSIIAHIQAEDAGSSITGISHDINSSLSALHADKQMLRAYNGAVVREEYVKPDFKISDEDPLNLTQQYTTVARNMTNMANYNWSSTPESVYLADGGLLGDVAKPFKDGTVIGTRTNAATAVGKNEVTQLKKNGTHEVVFSGTSSHYIVPVVTRHYVDSQLEGNYELYKEETHYVEVGSLVKVDDFQLDFSWTESTYEGADKTDFIAEKNGTPLEINYKYIAEL
ncbi:hypothetical protein [Enterococcus wangshanyuanii]|uniref:Uncharacterized protein n=1 Tax=Enterococcus wangshanyuanii TaxID=2005703 RepID=A0ABQ1PGM8_9ENTE|nr:hypothetical protein [Enterococcus wangshanyuanii]GGC96847.1 hypothetical protein GCM10011573_28030 [Enterococcus wangshanyuanii]